MGANTRSISILGSVTVVLSLAVDAVAFQFFNSTPSGIPSTCGDILLYIVNKTLEVICVPDCKDLFYEYRSTVENVCGTTVYDFPGVNQNVQSFLDPLAWAFNVPCLTSGDEYCYLGITNRKNSIEPCSDCFLQYEAAMLGSVYGRQHAQATLTRHQRAPVVQQTHLLLVRLLQLAPGPLTLSRRAIAVTPFWRHMKLLRIFAFG
ncbi:hypothetical protein M747DRAFT_277642 [Aspergillus niger ATCC 13496]|uniref:Uncharacterized protein n=3 Tax=Aspergillus niger TaxID=5061 RepID=A2R0U2_ASPNC|nr:hypothetical protein An12g09800 [Aspergillus niger]RDH21953.1 hypothetical protein M747DRAFT_277642 [Aspergillus niger ATCC 13496]CAL00884.1 hypothetical protein An12g09800 [Aspergillus niger]